MAPWPGACKGAQLPDIWGRLKLVGDMQQLTVGMKCFHTRLRFYHRAQCFTRLTAP